MKTSLLLVVGAICGLALALVPAVSAHLHMLTYALRPTSQSGARAHTEERFEFTADAPMERVVPLFGADKEHVWVPKWNPQFIHPSPAADVQGMVFTIAHHHLTATWVNTEFDLANGRIQYVYVIPDVMLTTITLRVKPQGERTHVEVEYDRTALTPDADARVREMGEQDRVSGPEWEKQINQALK